MITHDIHRYRVWVGTSTCLQIKGPSQTAASADMPLCKLPDLLAHGRDTASSTYVPRILLSVRFAARDSSASFASASAFATATKVQLQNVGTHYKLKGQVPRHP